MNLHGVVRGAITAVNPDVPAVLRICSGYTADSVGRRTPTYEPDLPVKVQVQDLSQKDIQHLDSLSIQGSQKIMYLSGALSGMVRSKNKGGDLVLLKDGPVWLVTAVLEQWPDWCKVSVTLQNETDWVSVFPFPQVNPQNNL